jgi:hypothetical protein
VVCWYELAGVHSMYQWQRGHRTYPGSSLVGLKVSACLAALKVYNKARKAQTLCVLKQHAVMHDLRD